MTAIPDTHSASLPNIRLAETGYERGDTLLHYADGADEYRVTVCGSVARIMWPPAEFLSSSYPPMYVDPWAQELQARALRDAEKLHAMSGFFSGRARMSRGDA